MTERPILFQGDMVRALLAGTKTQTRRAVRFTNAQQSWLQDPSLYLQRMYGTSPPPNQVEFGKRGLWRIVGPDYPDSVGDNVWCPYGAPGDRLWVRESWMPDPPDDGTWAYTAWAGERIGRIAAVPERFRHPAFCNYAASWLHGKVLWTPGIHMPRWASRITLEVTAVRVERLQAISETDARAEGIELRTGPESYPMWRHYGMTDTLVSCPIESYRTLWDSINAPRDPGHIRRRRAKGKPTDRYDTAHPVPAVPSFSWDANPYVWVVEFRRVCS